MSTTHIDVPNDLVPLGVVHLMDADRIEWLMSEVEGRWRTKKLRLWGYKDRVQFAPEVIEYEPGIELNWIADEPRQGRDILEGMRLGHYCEVAAYYAVEGREPLNISRRGLGLGHVGMDIEVSYADLEQLLFEDEEVPDAPAAAAVSAPKRTGRRGPPPAKRNAVKQAMLVRLNAGDHLGNWDQVALSFQFNANRETCCKALDELASELRDPKLRQLATRDK